MDVRGYNRCVASNVDCATSTPNKLSQDASSELMRLVKSDVLRLSRRRSMSSKHDLWFFKAFFNSQHKYRLLLPWISGLL